MAGIAQAQTQTGYRVPPIVDIGGGRMTGDMWCQYGTNGVRFKIGTQAVTQVGTVGVINGTNVTALPSLDFTYGGGSLSANFNGFNAVYVAGSQVGTSGAMAGKLDAVSGIGTTNTLNSPTFAGVGTITASFGANGLVISPVEYSCTDGISGNIQTQIDTKLTKVNGVSTYIGSVTAGGKTGTSSFAIVAGTNVTTTSTLSAEGHLEVTVNASGTLSTTFSSLTGSATASQLPTSVALTGTTSSFSPQSYAQIGVNVDTAMGLYGVSNVLLHCNNPGSTSFTDSSSNNFTVTAVGNAIGTTTAKFGSGGGYLDAVGDCLTLADNDIFNIGTGTTATRDIFVYLLALPGSRGTLMQHVTASNVGLQFDIMSTGKMRLNLSGDGTSWNIASDLEGSATIATGTWTAIKLVYDGANYKTYVNGALDITATSTSGLCNSTTVFSLGAKYDASTALNCVIDEFRLSNYWADISVTATEYSADNSAASQIYTYKYITPVSGATAMMITSSGTDTNVPTIISFNSTHSVFGSLTSRYSPVGQAGGTATLFAIDASNRNVLGIYYSPSEESMKVVHAAGTRSSRIEEMKKLRMGEWSWRTDVNRLEAEAVAKADFVKVSLNEKDYEIMANGTVTIDINRREADLIALKGEKELEWASVYNQSELITKKEDEMEAGKEKYITPFAGDETTPAILQDGDKRALCINNEVGFAYQTIQEMIDVLGSLTTRLDRAGIP